MKRTRSRAPRRVPRRKWFEVPPVPGHRLMVFVPEGDRTSKREPVDVHDRWVLRIMRHLGRSFGGATAYGRGVGVWEWRDRLWWDRITVVESWIPPGCPDISRPMNGLCTLLARVCRDLNQDEVGCMLNGVWIAVEKLERA